MDDPLEFWNECLERARHLIKRNHGYNIELTSNIKNYKYRTELCELTEDACQTYEDGKEDWPKEFTIKRFCDALNINYKSMMSWLTVKRRLFDHLTLEEQNHFCWTSASRAVNRVASSKINSPETTIKMYYEILKLESEAEGADLAKIEKNISLVQYLVSKASPDQLIKISAQLKIIQDDIYKNLKSA